MTAADKDQLRLFDLNPGLARDPHFSVRPQHDGPGLEPADQERLGTLMDRVVSLMLDGEWRTLSEIASRAQGSEASVSARLRDMRKERFQDRYGALTVEKRRVSQGLYEYRVQS